MQGLPASGKSTRANELVKSMGNAVRVNKDLLRTMLHFDKYTGRNEALTRHAARLLVTGFIEQEINVIIDDTNLNPSTMQSWKDLGRVMGCATTVEKVTTDYAECVKRDSNRDDPVGEHVIFFLALANNLYPQPKKGFVICDIDGTIAHITHRRHFVNGDKKDWKGFFSEIGLDSIRQDVYDQVKAFQKKGYEVIYVSGRPDDYREVTMDWLRANGIRKPKLLMRRSGDSRDDTIIKAEIYEACFENKYEVYKVIDDRPRVIRMWREKGLDVIDVGDGVEF